MSNDVDGDGREEGRSGGSRPIMRVAIYSLLINVALFTIKLFLSTVSGSLALKADALHSLVDVFDSAALILGLSISERKSKSFPYGLYKVENVFSIFIALMIFLSAFEIARHAVAVETAPVYDDWIIFAVAALIPVPLLFGLYEVRAGEAANSPGLVADGTQFKADALTESLVLFALIGQRFGLPLDRAAALLIAFFVVRGGWEILKSGMRVLLDASVDPATLEGIRETILADPTVTSVKAVTARNSGRYIFVEAQGGLPDKRPAEGASEERGDRGRDPQEVPLRGPGPNPLRAGEEDPPPLRHPPSRSRRGGERPLRRGPLLRPGGYRPAAEGDGEAGGGGQPPPRSDEGERSQGGGISLGV